MVASFVMENIQVAIKKVSNEGILVIEAPTRITIQYATEPWEAENYFQFFGIMWKCNKTFQF